jgi:SH3-like domain-containing protein
MARKLKLIKGAAERSALIYGMRIFGPTEVAAVDDAQVRLADGSKGRVTMHLIEGTRTQIRRQLMQSIDAFFELLDEEPAR